MGQYVRDEYGVPRHRHADRLWPRAGPDQPRSYSDVVNVVITY